MSDTRGRGCVCVCVCVWGGVRVCGGECVNVCVCERSKVNSKERS